MTYLVNVYREDRWWMIRIPELDDYDDGDGHVWPGEAITQARRFGEIENQARDYICTVTDCAPSEVALDVHADVAGFDISTEAREIAVDRQRVDDVERDLKERIRMFAMHLHVIDIPVRDIGTILGVSHQRVSQLIGEFDRSAEVIPRTSVSRIAAVSNAAARGAVKRPARRVAKNRTPSTGR